MWRLDRRRCGRTRPPGVLPSHCTLLAPANGLQHTIAATGQVTCRSYSPRGPAARLRGGGACERSVWCAATNCRNLMIGCQVPLQDQLQRRRKLRAQQWLRRQGYRRRRLLLNRSRAAMTTWCPALEARARGVSPSWESKPYTHCSHPECPQPSARRHIHAHALHDKTSVCIYSTHIRSSRAKIS